MASEKQAAKNWCHEQAVHFREKHGYKFRDFHGWCVSANRLSMRKADEFEIELIVDLMMLGFNSVETDREKEKELEKVYSTDWEKEFLDGVWKANEIADEELPRTHWY